MNKLNRLTWKYFFKQKWEEISIVLLVLFIIWSAAGLIFQFGWVCQGWWSDGCITYETTFPIWMMISGLITTGIWAIVGLIYWIKENWEYALEKAKKKLKEKK